MNIRNPNEPRRDELPFSAGQAGPELRAPPGSEEEIIGVDAIALAVCDCASRVLVMIDIERLPARLVDGEWRVNLRALEAWKRAR